MNSNSTDISLSSYFNDIVVGFYEDTGLVESLGHSFGFDVNKDSFLALSFLYPWATPITYDDKTLLHDQLEPLLKLGPINQTIDSNQILLADRGVVIFFIAHTKQELLNILPSVKDEALKLTEHFTAPKNIRIGIGTIETGLEGIEQSYQNSLRAVDAGELFKKERRVLDFMGMEIYSAINTMVVNYGDALTKEVLKQLTDPEQRILGKYYKCKESVSETAAALRITEAEVLEALNQTRLKTGLDVNDTEDSFKLHFIMIAKKVLDKKHREEAIEQE